MARKPDNTTSTGLGQLIEYRLQLIQLLSYCVPVERSKIRADIALVDSFITEMRGSKRMIMVVDDEQLMAETLVEVLLHSGYEAFSTAHAGDALALAADLRPDLALIDVILGEVSGVELALELHNCVPEMKLLLISGHPNAKDYLATYQPRSAVLDLLEKPVPPEELLMIIAEHLGQADERREQEISVRRQSQTSKFLE